jgi:hypothetical protein
VKNAKTTRAKKVKAQGTQKAVKKRLFHVPSSQAGPTVLADFAELLALRREDFKVSDRHLMTALERISEEDEDALERPLNDAFQELAIRILHLGPDARDRYPFEVAGDLLSLRMPLPSADNEFLYLFLLLATRLNMKSNRQHGGHDGAELFEHVCLEVAKRYWGGAGDVRVNGVVFGTARYHRDAKDDDEVDEAKFSTAVEALCGAMREGNGYRAKDPPPIKAKDAKLDIVVWRDFADQRAVEPVDKLRHRHGKLIGFGQCKTGSTWLDHLGKLKPEKFCEDWFHDVPLVRPVNMFFVCDRFVRPWHEKTRTVLLFDRCRVLEYADKLPQELVTKCASWSRAALAAHGIKWWK